MTQTFGSHIVDCALRCLPQSVPPWLALQNITVWFAETQCPLCLLRDTDTDTHTQRQTDRHTEAHNRPTLVNQQAALDAHRQNRGGDYSTGSRRRHSNDDRPIVVIGASSWVSAVWVGR